ncbi:acyltransferase domain-containing protein, partial [Merdimonas faecis]|uniref:acyltransferase domain-containing protein n=1 Tax=Merdimonas faecis TaxID=1653435 RepID=UPI0023FA0550
MEVLELCEKIGLQPEVKKRVEEISKEFDFGAAEEILKDFHDYDKMKEAWMRLEEKIGEDSEHMKILTCMLKASADAYEIYQKKEIEDSIYFATMKCYTRFLEEAYERTGRYVFDRYWWTGRQAGCHLFRIGELEYEIIRTDGKSPEGDSGISIHIPSDADFSPACVDESLGAAKHFFAEYD